MARLRTKLLIEVPRRSAAWSTPTPTPFSRPIRPTWWHCSLTSKGATERWPSTSVNRRSGPPGGQSAPGDGRSRKLTFGSSARSSAQRPHPIDGRGQRQIEHGQSARVVCRQHKVHLVPPDVDVGVVVGRLGGRPDLVDEGQGLGEVAPFDRGLKLVTPWSQEMFCSVRLSSTSSDDSFGSLTGGSSPRAARRHRIALPLRNPSARAASRSVVPSLCAFLATWADLS